MNILMTLANPFTHDPRVYMEARSLIKAGHKVTVLAWDRDGNNKPYEIKDLIEIVRSSNSRLMNLARYDIFKMYLWWNKGYKDALKLFKKKKFDVIHSHDLSSLKIGIRLKKRFSLPLIYDAHEIFGYMITQDVPKFFVKQALETEKNWIKDVDHIITVNEPLKDYFSKISNKPITIVMNAKEVKNIKYEPSKTDNLSLVYLGALNDCRFLPEAIDTIKEIPDVNLIMGGIGKKEYIEYLKNKCSQAKNINFIGTLPMKEVLPMTKKCDVILCMFDPKLKINQVGLPNKLFEAMVCGRPIICTKGIHSGEFVEKEKCGLAIGYKKDDLKRTIIKLRDNPELCEELGKKGINAALLKYSWEKQEKNLLQVYKGVL